jgi:hypothetical protein
MVSSVGMKQDMIQYMEQFDGDHVVEEYTVDFREDNII